MKNIFLQCCLSFLCAFLHSQTPGNLQIQVTIGTVSGSTPADPNVYSFHQNGNNLLGAIINLPPIGVATLTLQSNNSRLKFINSPGFMQSLDLNFDNQGFDSFHPGGSINETNWITPPSSFMTVGTHNLKVQFSVTGNSFFREYIVLVTDASQEFHVDNTASTLTTGNTLTLWDNPTCSDAEPLLLSEGFDPTNSDFPEFYRFRGAELTQKLFELGYKVYILNYNLNGQNMQNNAAVYIAALRYLSQINGGKKVVAAGISMGGVIARFALARGEAENLNLPVSLLLSLDAPQRGAVIDRPLQDFIKSQQPDNAALNAPASRQLLINHAWENGESHNAFFNELRSLNGDGYPHLVPKIGIAFSNNTANPNTGSEWLKINKPGGNVSFNVINEWAVAGSFLPGSTTNINVFLPRWFRLLPLTGTTATVERLSNPTFIPFNSALDITNGVSKFSINIAANAASAHDEVPNEVTNTLKVEINKLSSPTTIAVNETFNFTSLQGNWIRQNTTVFGGLVINRSGESASSFNPQPESPTSLFDLRTKACDPITINIESGGKLELGDLGASGDLNASLTLKSGDLLRIKSNATLRIKKNSQINIGVGAKLIIDGASILDLVDANSKIVIQDGGELIINGQPSITGNGHIRFEQGNIFTPNSSLVLRGTGRNNPIIVFGQNATVTVENPVELRIEDAALVSIPGLSYPQRHLWLKNGATLKANNTLFDDQAGTLNYSVFIEVEDPFDTDNDPDDVDYEFTNCFFKNNRASLKLFVPNGTNGLSDWRNLNLAFVNCEFLNCGALQADRSYITLFDNCTLNNSSISVRTTYWLNIRNTRIRGSGGGTGIKVARVGHFWFRESSLISRFEKGIDASEAPNWNIIMTDQSTIQECNMGILLDGYRFGLGDDIGLLHMDCARMIQNINDIKGTDIIFSAYTRGATANIFTKNEDVPTGLYIESIFKERWNETDVWLHGNYWDGNTPSTTPINNDWSFKTKNPHLAPWNGTIHIVPTRMLSDPSMGTCGGVDLRSEPNDPLDSNTIVNVNGIYRNVKIQQDAGWRKLSQKNLKDAITLMQPVAGLSNSITDTASNTVNHLVDVAKCFAIGRGAQSRSATKQDGWLPETFVGYAKPKENTFAISPNPTADQFDITLPKGDYTLQVFDALGKLIFSKNTEESSKVDVHAWQNGIYMVSLWDKSNKKKTFSKNVVQH